MEALAAHVKQAMKPEKFPQESDPATKVNEKPKVVKGAKTTGMPEGMQEIMDEIKGELDVASKEHAKQLIESKGLYEKELQKLELEFSMSGRGSKAGRKIGRHEENAQTCCDGPECLEHWLWGLELSINS